VLSLESLADVVGKHHDALKARVAEFELGGRVFASNERPAVMGVINLSSDSWYRESVVPNPDAAIRRGQVLRAQGADLVDVGAESTLHHAARVEPAAQTAKLASVVHGLREKGVLVSAETYDPTVAKACLEAGAQVINLTGRDPGDAILRMAAEHDAGVILCHVQGEHVRAVEDFEIREDPVGFLYEYFARQVERAVGCGLKRLFLDPGLGFYYRNLEDGAARVRHQMTVFLESFRLRRLGWPVCQALPHAFEFFQDQVRCAEPFFAVLASLGRTDLFRTHEVPRVRAVLETLRAF
jgi:dihydropteroate synthase